MSHSFAILYYAETETHQMSNRPLGYFSLYENLVTYLERLGHTEFDKDITKLLPERPSEGVERYTIADGVSLSINYNVSPTPAIIPVLNMLSYSNDITYMSFDKVEYHWEKYSKFIGPVLPNWRDKLKRDGVYKWEWQEDKDKKISACSITTPTIDPIYTGSGMRTKSARKV